jgi:hypothetical protein
MVSDFMVVVNDFLMKTEYGKTDAIEYVRCEIQIRLIWSPKNGLVANGKSNQRNRLERFGLSRDVLDVRAHLMPDRSEKRVEFATFTFGHELDSAVREVANETGNLETPSQRLAREAKPYPLNPAREKDSATIPRHEFQLRRSAGPDNSHSNTASSQTFTTFHEIS